MCYRTTGCTGEAITLTKTRLTTTRAVLTSPVGILPIDSEPYAPSLVGREVLQLAKGPSRHQAIQVGIADLRALPDVRQALEVNHPVSVGQGFRYELLAEVMVLPSNPPELIAREPFQEPLGSARAFGLETGANLHPVLFKRLPCRAIMQGAMRGDCRISDPEIDTHGWTLPHVSIGIFDHDMDIPAVPLLDHRGGGWLLAAQRITLVGTQQQRDMDATAHGGQRDGFVPLPVVENAGVVVDARGPKFLRSSLPFLGRVDRRTDPTNGTHDQVSGQAVVFTDRPVHESMQLHVIPDVLLKSGGKNRVTRPGKRLTRALKRLDHRCRGNHSATYCSFAHSDHCITTSKHSQDPTLEVSAFLSPLKQGVSSR